MLTALSTEPGGSLPALTPGTCRDATTWSLTLVPRSPDPSLVGGLPTRVARAVPG